MWTRRRSSRTRMAMHCAGLRRFEGLGVASRCLRAGPLRQRLIRLDVAAPYMRHITVSAVDVLKADLCVELEGELQNMADDPEVDPLKVATLGQRAALTKRAPVSSARAPPMPMV